MTADYRLQPMTTSLQNWPLNIDFTAAIQNPQVCFRDELLRQAQAAKNSRGGMHPVRNRLLLWPGNFATVYKLSAEERTWAVRCFTRLPQPDVQQRYTAISEHLTQHRLPYLVNFQFISDGILVKGNWYPILKMEWVEGQELDRYIGEHLEDADNLALLHQRIKQLQRDLRHNGIAHGDLQHGNIMVAPSGQLQLVDYDGMYVPALQGMPSCETGHPNYQLPARSPQDFSAEIDDFSFDVISLSLRALTQQPDLWQAFHEDNKNLLFRQDDFKQPLASAVFQAIAQIDDPETQALYAQLVRKCCDHLKAIAPLHVYGLHETGDSVPAAPVKHRVTESASAARFLPMEPHRTIRDSAIQRSPRAAWPEKLALPYSPQFGKWKWVMPSVGLLLLTISLAILAIDNKRKEDSYAPFPSLLSAATAKAITPLTGAELVSQYKAGRRNFTRVSLTGIVLNGVNLNGIDLSDSILAQVELRQASLNGADLHGAVLTGADLRGANFTEANLSEANLSKANLSEANLTKANLLRANLSQASLDFAILRGAQLMQANLSAANLGLANLNAADLLLTNLTGANLTKANLRESNLNAANLSEANLDSADLLLADLRSSELHRTNLSHTNLSSSDLSSAGMALADLTGANLSNANLSNTRFDKIGSIQDANFTDSFNLSPATKQYFCLIAAGSPIYSPNRLSTRDTLNCHSVTTATRMKGIYTATDR